MLCSLWDQMVRYVTALSISTASVTKLLVIEQLLHPALKSTVSAPWPTFQLCPSSQQILATLLPAEDKWITFEFGVSAAEVSHIKVQVKRPKCLTSMRLAKRPEVLVAPCVTVVVSAGARDSLTGVSRNPNRSVQADHIACVVGSTTHPVS